MPPARRATLSLLACGMLCTAALGADETAPPPTSSSAPPATALPATPPATPPATLPVLTFTPRFSGATDPAQPGATAADPPEPDPPERTFLTFRAPPPDHGGPTGGFAGFSSRPAGPGRTHADGDADPAPAGGSHDPFALRQGGALGLSNAVRLEVGYFGLDPDHPGPLASATVIENRGREGGGRDGGDRDGGPAPVTVSDSSFNLYDLSLNLDALRVGPMTFQVLGGVRAFDLEHTTTQTRLDASGLPIGSDRSRAGRLVPVPVAGGGLRLDLNRGFYIRGSGVGSAGESENDYIDLMLESGIALSPDVGLSIGYQRLKGDVGGGQLGAEVRRDALMLQLRISY